MEYLHTRHYPISREGGRSAMAASAYRSGYSIVAASTYRAGDRIKREEDGQTYDYTRKAGIVHAEILLPQNAPEKFTDRGTLWNEVERVEDRINSRLANQWEAAIPKEFCREDQINLARNFALNYFVNRGTIVDFALHDKGGGNPHAHFLLTTRGVTKDGFEGNKYSARDWFNKRAPGEWRNAWADECNKIYQRMGLPDRIDPRSYKKQGLDKEPTKPLGKHAHQLEQRGIATPEGDKNRAIRERNKQREVMQAETPRRTLYDPAIINAQHPEAKPVEEPERPAVPTEIRTEYQPNYIRQDPTTRRETSGQGKQTVEWAAVPVVDKKSDRLPILESKDSPTKEKSTKTMAQLNEELRLLRGTQQAIAKAEATFYKWEGEINRIKGELQNLSPLDFQTRSNLNWQLESLTNSRNQAAASLDRDHQLKPEQAKSRLAEIDPQIKALEQQRAGLPDPSQKRQEEPVERQHKTPERDRTPEPEQSRSR